jgi:hypothetical protein
MSTPTQSGNSPRAKGSLLVGDGPSKEARRPTSGAATTDGRPPQDTGRLNMNPRSWLRWIPRLLALLVILCLFLAGWVWYQIYRML